MATWTKGKTGRKVTKKSEKSKKPSKEKDTTNLLPALLFTMLIIGAIYLYAMAPQPLAPTTLAVSTDYEYGIGKTQIFVHSNNPLNGVNVFVGVHQAKQKTWEEPYTFEFYTTPYDDTGFTPVVVEAIDEQGRYSKNASFAVNKDFFVAGAYLGGIMFYSEDFIPLPTARALVFNNNNLSFFFELESKQSELNQKIISAYVPFITELASQGKNLQMYAIEVNDGEWVNCMDSEAEMLPLQECRALLDKGPCIHLAFPEYPTTQVYVTNTTIRIETSMQGMPEGLNAVLALLDISALITPR